MQGASWHARRPQERPLGLLGLGYFAHETTPRSAAPSLSTTADRISLGPTRTTLAL